ncbi:hypothetical protein OC834_004239 [Tilletia horrida]|uniref:Fungal lipase-type domain-containing protein n=1 Tax=Tilletia horrida TaxID=155126 RepID=A0AAN6GFP5_9BASI|nr:hypothetical protein OC834_004239 [Tilletia horrida]KAK0530072.1 hypothetical protein OC835_004130 [Tilletia horrida]KAK0534501.1 hypothetical protein OC842_002619 [Tilletia horrida]KAK0559132.1 hypothetical protein OC844_004627 [Tilletia horrida]
MQFSTLLLGALAPLAALALPLEVEVDRRQSTATPYAVTDPTPYQDPARWSQAAYCYPAAGQVLNGANVLWATGDGRDIPYVYVAYAPSSNTVVISHQGTNTSSLSSIENDIDAGLDAPGAYLTGCLPSNAQVHSGFQETFEATASGVYTNVVNALRAHPGAHVLVTGHSLGGAISVLDHAYLSCRLPSSGTSYSSLRSIVFGKPRAGDHVWANWVDSHLTTNHITNDDDIVPHLPPSGKDSNDYWQESGEIWINPRNSNSAVFCPGQENANCARGVSIFDYSISAHLGTYFGVPINGRDSC